MARDTIFYCLPLNYLFMIDRALEDLDYQDLHQESLMNADKLPNPTAFTTNRHTISNLSPSNPPYSDSFPEPLELSFEAEIYQGNARLIKQGLAKFVHHTVDTPLSTSEDIFIDGRVFAKGSLENGYIQDDHINDIVLQHNELISPLAKKVMSKNFKEYPELKALILEVNKQLGAPLTCQLTYLLNCVLESKLNTYLEAVQREEKTYPFPRFDCFVGQIDRQMPHFGGCNINEGLEYAEVRKLATDGVQEIGGRLYYSKSLQLIGLRTVNCEIRKGVSVADKFATLLVFLSRCFLLNLAGFAVSEQQLTELNDHLSFDLSRSQEGSKKVKTS